MVLWEQRRKLAANIGVLLQAWIRFIWIKYIFGIFVDVLAIDCWRQGRQKKQNIHSRYVEPSQIYLFSPVVSWIPINVSNLLRPSDAMWLFVGTNTFLFITDDHLFAANYWQNFPKEERNM